MSFSATYKTGHAVSRYSTNSYTTNIGIGLERQPATFLFRHFPAVSASSGEGLNAWRRSGSFPEAAWERDPRGLRAGGTKVECAICHLSVNISGILHARPTYDISSRSPIFGDHFDTNDKSGSLTPIFSVANKKGPQKSTF